MYIKMSVCMWFHLAIGYLCLNSLPCRWAIAYAGFSLVQNYGTNLFDAINSKSNLNGHVLAASQAAGGLGAFCAVYLENFAAKTGMSIYILGSAVMGVLCVCMGFSMKIWVAYSLYVMISGIYQTLACLVIVRCGRLVSNRHFILLFSVNSFVGLALETLLQAALVSTYVWYHFSFRTYFARLVWTLCLASPIPYIWEPWFNNFFYFIFFFFFFS